ncbi:hypothetical protein [Haloprofundus halobius]|uniref:hypothetical protein n=1 Tax=Haloprofundus halobius TaxID=2876194 RepID=UPI001CCD71EE|nr:hypothetical protein [Haloprofundus halobius]
MRKLVISLLILSLALSGVPISAHAQSSSTYEGVIVNVSAQAEANYVSETSSIVESYGFDSVQHASLLFTDSGTRYVVLSNSDPAVGQASLNGVEILPPEGGLGLLVATSLKVNPEGTEVPLDELEKNPKEYQYEFVQVSASVTQLTHTVDATEGEVVLQESLLGLGEERFSFSTFKSPGREGKWSTVNLSLAKQNHELNSELTGRLPLSTSSIGRASQQTRWWMSANATVNMLVVGGGGGSVAAIIGQTTPESTTVSDLDELSAHTGEVVTVTANGVGSSLSTQETLLSAAKCAPSSITNPVTGCLPVPTDGVVHSGTLFDSPPKNSDQLVYYAGVSNTVQDTPVEPETGKYRVTGRVVDATQLDPRLKGTALIVYDRERVGHLSIESSTAKESASTVREYIREQQLSSQSEWQSITATANAETGQSTEKPTQTPSLNEKDSSSNTAKHQGKSEDDTKNGGETAQASESNSARQSEGPSDSILRRIQRPFNGESSFEAVGLMTGLGSIVFLISGVILSLIDMLGKLLGNENMEIEYEWIPWVIGIALLAITYIYSTT